MKDCKTYLIENQIIKRTRTSDILKDCKSRSKRRQIMSQFMPFYNAICGLLEVEQKPTRQQSTKSKMKHNKIENMESLITRFFRQHKKLDFNGSAVMKKIKNYIIRTFQKIQTL